MQTKSIFLLLAFLGAICTSVLANENGDYIVGVGIADVTGPSADIGMMGYANPEQSARGIHTRLFARAFTFQSHHDDSPAVFVSADIGMVDQGLKFMVVQKLQEKYGPNLFTQKNVLLSGTHTHSGPAAYLQYLMYSITSLGFNQGSFDAIVDGMVQSIERAYSSRQPGKVFINKGKVENANINRSPTAYKLNPPEWRAPYQDSNGKDVDVDKDMILLSIESADGKPMGSVNWFAVHPTSMNNTNRLISGDNKGYASMIFEYKMNPDSRPGQGKYVAAFASSNLGDVSPNTEGPRCIDTGLPCNELDNTCPTELLPGVPGLPTVTNCIAFGPGRNMEESTEIIGERQFNEAFRLFEDKEGRREQLKGPIKFVHQYVNMTNYTVEVLDPIRNVIEEKMTCLGALGNSFAAGTTDGPGLFAFKQGDQGDDNPLNTFWELITSLVKLNPQDPRQKDCHWPKPILLSVGEAHVPYDWVASVVETQILQIGNAYLAGIPGELTTMSGRRLRETLHKILLEKLPNTNSHVIIAGLSNVYTHYIATYYEYQQQRYEGASTLYGPFTLDAYLKQYSILTDNIITGGNLEDGPTPPNFLNRQLSMISPIVQDTAPLLKKFGDVLVEPVPEVNPGETVTVHVVGGHPRNSPMRGGTFLLVEMHEESEQGNRWNVVATDADWSTKFRWSRPNFLSKESRIEISWKVPQNAVAGFYRIRHFGLWKSSVLQPPRSYEATSALFKINGVVGNSTSLSHPEWNPNRNKASKIQSAFDFWRALPAAAKKL